MPKNSTIKIALLLLGAIILGALLREAMFKVAAKKTTTSYVPALQINGDIKNPLTLLDEAEFDSVDFEYKGERKRGIPLASIIQSTEPITEKHEILFIGEDGLSALIDGSNLDGCHILLSENGWEAINLLHPVSSNVKRLKEIIIIAPDAPLNFGVNIISQTENLAYFTPGQLYKETGVQMPYFEGTSTVTNDGGQNSVSIFTRRQLYPLRDLVDFSEAEQFVVMGAKGETLYTSDPGFLQVNKNFLNYFSLDRENEIIENVKGFMIAPPSRSITDLYHDTLHYLQRDEKVLLLFLDGFGYHQYEYAKENGYIPFLSTLPQAEKALSVYQPVTNAGFAAMITGKTPDENGVYSRDQMDLKTPSIFAMAKQLGKESALIEGHIKILNTEIEPVLNIDLNGDGKNEDEIYSTALEYVKDANYDLIMVHFHSIDDAGHSYGDLHENTMEQLKVVDGYVRDLVEAWKGKVIILADHGMHSTEDAGNHGEFRYEDLIVPYIIAEGGRIE
ncbi:MAG: hypothetical protein GX893_06710 [Firmicutes bacterium]|nr:hypothetical protein [Bacillota bacterium]